MKDVRKGRTHAGYEAVTYTLSSVFEVETLWRKIQSIMEENTGRKGYDFSQLENSFVRYVEADNEIYLIVGTTGKDQTTLGRKKDNLEDYSSEDAELRMISDLTGYKTIETDRGLFAADVSEYKDKEDELRSLYRRLLCSDSDFNMDLGDMVHMSWKPSFVEDKFVILPSCTPSTTSSTWDFKEIAGVTVNLC